MPHARQNRASWYAQGLSDGIGDRLLMFDNSGGPSLELLRFSWKLAGTPGFENALRERVELLSQFRHPSFAKVRAVEKLDPKNDLTLVSNHVSGKRLSEALSALRGPAFATWLIRDVIGALVSLQAQGRGVAHGALTADRVLVTSEGRLVVVEHVLGSAVDRLDLSANDLWSRFGIAVPPSTVETVRLDPQTDVFQLGLVALSVLLGRAIASYEYPHRLEELLDRFEKSTARDIPTSLRSWLVRALHISGQPFNSAQDAQRGLGELDTAPSASELLLADGGTPIQPEPMGLPPLSIRPATAEPVNVRAPAAEFMAPPPPAVERTSPPIPEPAPSHTWPEFTAFRAESASARIDGDAGHNSLLDDSDIEESARPIAGPRLGIFERMEPIAVSEPAPDEIISSERPHTRPPVWERELVAADLLNDRLDIGQRRWLARFGGWAMPALGALALLEAAVIAYLLYVPVRTTPSAATVMIESPQPGAQIQVDGKDVGVTPLPFKVGPGVRSIRVVGPEPPAQALDTTAQTISVQGMSKDPVSKPPEPIRVADTPKTGGIRLISQVEVQVLDGDKVLGSSADGAIVAPPGRHEFELVNSSLGYRSRQVFNVKAGEITSLNLARPEGRISINAVPWADVWIDRVHVGETPLANLSIPIGQHEVSFRHPSFGEQKRTAIVRYDVPTRLSADLR
jgi:hypothetical protein